MTTDEHNALWQEWNEMNYNPVHLPVLRDIGTVLWLEWFTNEDGYWDDDAIEYRRV